MSGKPPKNMERPERWANHEEREHEAVDEAGEALAECYRILIEAGALKPLDEGEAPA